MKEAANVAAFFYGIFEKLKAFKKNAKNLTKTIDNFLFIGMI